MSEMTIVPVATHGFFVDGRWVEDGDLVEVRSPFDSSVVGRVVEGRREHAEAAYRGPPSRPLAYPPPACVRTATSVAQRGSIDCRAQRRIFPHSSARSWQAHQSGAHGSGSRGFHVNVAAEESTRIYGEYIPLDWQEYTAGRWGMVRRFPLGPIAGITPF